MCLACDPGEKLVGSTCVQCETGKYSGLGATECTSCEKGRYQNAKSRAGCIACGAGTYGDQIGQIARGTGVGDGCKSCGAGKYSSALGATAKSQCNLCGTGKYGILAAQAIESIACVACQTGRVNPTNGATKESDCKQCPPKTYQDETSQSSCKLDVCGKGQHQADGVVADPSKKATCHDCPAGFYSSSTGLMKASECNSCSIGTYGNLTAARDSREHCTMCPAGKKGILEGQSSEDTGCVNCELGKEYVKIR
jgi:hypothetical protein